MIPTPLLMAISAMSGSIGSAIAAGVYFSIRHNKTGN